MKKVLTERFSIRLLVLGIVILFFAVIVFVWNDWNFSFSNKIQADKFGQFGDIVGGLIGSIWSLAGVILFYVALTEQRNDFATNREVLKAQTDALKQQIQEFELQREELKETRKVFKIQSETLIKEQFESTFFNLLNLHHEIVGAIDLKSVSRKYPRNRHKLSEAEKNETTTEITTGRDCFVKFAKGFINTYNHNKREKTIEDELELIKVSYQEYYENHQSDLGHYFRNLYHIFKFIKNSDEQNKKTYTSLVRAQLSNSELFLLFYNCLSDLGNEKFKPLIEEFQLLKNLNPRTLINLELHYGFYNKSAYKK